MSTSLAVVSVTRCDLCGAVRETASDRSCARVALDRPRRLCASCACGLLESTRDQRDELLHQINESRAYELAADAWRVGRS